MVLLVKRRGSSPGPPQRRSIGGSRREASERVTLRAGSFEATGWTLNVSRGGVRIVLEDLVERGSHYDITIGDSEVSRRVKVVWVREQADGQIVGARFVDVDVGDSEPPEPPPDE
jgi:hypothetical protein